LQVQKLDNNHTQDSRTNVDRPLFQTPNLRSTAMLSMAYLEMGHTLKLTSVVHGEARPWRKEGLVMVVFIVVVDGSV
jgi:hypothetical protein